MIKRKRMAVLLCVAMMTTQFAGCGNLEATNKVTVDGEDTDFGESSDDAEESKETSIFPHHFADQQEAVECFLSNTDYFEGFSECELQYKMQNKDASIEQYIEFGKAQMGEFTEDEKSKIEDLLEEMEGDLKKGSYELPKLNEIVFINSTQVEEGGSAAYTHGTQIYYDGEYLSDLLSSDGEGRLEAKSLMWHEIFHCLTRSNPDFRKDMYSIISFTVVPEDYELPPSVQERFISNPDIGHHNSFASFAINGEKMDCFCDNIATRPFEKEGDTFFDNATTALVPIDGEDLYYLPEDTDNFWDVFGRNTDYALDPEECMADNFSYAMTYGLTGRDYENPEIIEKILDSVKK